MHWVTAARNLPDIAHLLPSCLASLGTAGVGDLSCFLSLITSYTHHLPLSLPLFPHSVIFLALLHTFYLSVCMRFSFIHVHHSLFLSAPSIPILPSKAHTCLKTPPLSSNQGLTGRRKWGDQHTQRERGSGRRESKREGKKKKNRQHFNCFLKKWRWKTEVAWRGMVKF